MKVNIEKLKLMAMPSAQRAIVKDLYIPKLLKNKVKKSQVLDDKDGNNIVD